MYCNSCGELNDDNEVKCKKCGNMIANNQTQSQEQTQSVNDNMSMIMYMEKQRQIDECNAKIEKLESSKKTKKLIDGILAVICIVMLIYTFIQDLYPLLEKTENYSGDWKIVADGLSELRGEATLEEQINSAIVKLVIIFVVGVAINICISVSIMSDEKEIKSLKKKRKTLNQTSIQGNISK